MSETPPTLKPGAVVGEYEVAGVLGKGGMGTVYAGVHPKIGKKVAIKVLNPEMADNADVIARFVQEARSVNQIGHKNIIDIFAFGDLPNNAGHYFVMERLEGESLASRITRDKRIPGGAAVAILEQVADAIDAAHRTGIWHRDLKPDNVFLVPDRGGPHVKVLDFGIAKLTEGAVAAATRTGVPMGTPMFMSPEQWKGREVDHRTDVYAMAVMAFAMLTGSHPFEAESFPTLMYMHLSEPPPPPSSRGAPAWADAPVLAGLAKEKTERPASAGAFVAALRAAMEGSSASFEGTMPAVAVEAPKPESIPTPSPAVESAKPIALESKPGDYFATQGKTLPPPARSRTGLIAGLGIVAAAAIGFGIYATTRGGEGPPTATQPPPEPKPNDKTIEANLTAAKLATSSENWTEVIKKANQVLALSPQHPEATVLEAKATEEMTTQKTYDRFKLELGGQRIEEAVRALAAIPGGSVYKARAAKELQDGATPWLEQQVVAAAAAAGKKKCADVSAIIHRVEASFADRADILAKLDAQGERCTGKPVTVRSVATTKPDVKPDPKPDVKDTKPDVKPDPVNAGSGSADPDKVKF